MIPPHATFPFGRLGMEKERSLDYAGHRIRVMAKSEGARLYVRTAAGYAHIGKRVANPQYEFVTCAIRVSHATARLFAVNFCAHRKNRLAVWMLQHNGCQPLICPRAVSEARVDNKRTWARSVCALSIQRHEGSRP